MPFNADSCAHRPFKVECAQQKRIPRYLWPVRRAHFDEGGRREMQPMKASCHDTDHLPILSVSRNENRVFGPETLRDTYESVHLSVS